MKFRSTAIAAFAVATAFVPSAVEARSVKGPLNSSTVTSTAYRRSGAWHGAIDIAAAASTCGKATVTTAAVGTLYWNVTIRTSSKVCYGNGSSRVNEATHAFSYGWKFRQYHFVKSGSSYDRTCDRCVIGYHGGTGNVTGPHSHLQRDKYGTKSASWISAKRGAYVTRSTTVGAF
jgi:hypothetical protein